MLVRPIVISSPLARTCVLTSLPLTFVPLPEPRSLTRYSSPTFSILACFREDFLSASGRTLSVARPMEISVSFSSTSRLSSPNFTSSLIIPASKGVPDFRPRDTV